MAKDAKLASNVLPTPRDRIRTIVLEHPDIKPGQVNRVMQDKYHVGVDYRTVRKTMEEMGKIAPKEANGTVEVSLAPIVTTQTVLKALGLVHQLGGVVTAKDVVEQINALGGLTTFTECVKFMEEIQRETTV